MPPLSNPLLDFCRDPLSDTTPTWIDVSGYLLAWEVWGGIESEGSQAEAGGARFWLDNRDRRFEPEYAAGAYYPDVVPLRRFRFRQTADAVTYNDGIYYVTDWGPDFTDGFNEEAAIVCVDGWGLTSLDNLSELDPPEATSVEEVINFDQPMGYWRLGDPPGTKLESHLRSKRYRRKHPKRSKRFRTVETAAEATGVSGPAGTYKNTPLLGEPGLVLGDPSTCVTFRRAQSEYARIPLEDADDTSGPALTVGLVYRVGSDVDTNSTTLVAGPLNGGFPVWTLWLDVGFPVFDQTFNDGGVGFTQGTIEIFDAEIHTIIATFDGHEGKIYLDGIWEDGDSNHIGGGGIIDVATETTPYVRIGNNTLGDFCEGSLQEVFIVQRNIGPARVLAIHQAMRERGFDTQLAGDRIESLLTSPLWVETGIPVGTMQLKPIMKYGQSIQDEVLDAMAAEGPDPLLYYNRAGDPVYLPWEYRDASPYNTSQVTFGTSGSEVPYEDIDMSYDDTIFNEVVGNAEGGPTQRELDATSQAQYKRRVNSGPSDLPLFGVVEADENAVKVVHAHLIRNKDPQRTVRSITLQDGELASRTQIHTRNIGDAVRVKHRPKGGTPIDQIAHIIGFRRSGARVTGVVTCTYHLSRGFNAATPTVYWRAGRSGFSNAGNSTRAA